MEEQEAVFAAMLNLSIRQLDLRSSALICGKPASATIVPSEIHWFQRSAH